MEMVRVVDSFIDFSFLNLSDGIGEVLAERILISLSGYLRRGQRGDLIARFEDDDFGKIESVGRCDLGIGRCSRPYEIAYGEGYHVNPFNVWCQSRGGCACADKCGGAGAEVMLQLYVSASNSGSELSVPSN